MHMHTHFTGSQKKYIKISCNVQQRLAMFQAKGTALR